MSKLLESAIKKIEQCPTEDFNAQAVMSGRSYSVRLDSDERSACFIALDSSIGWPSKSKADFLSTLTSFNSTRG